MGLLKKRELARNHEIRNTDTEVLVDRSKNKHELMKDVLSGSNDVVSQFKKFSEALSKTMKAILLYNSSDDSYCQNILPLTRKLENAHFELSSYFDKSLPEPALKQVVRYTHMEPIIKQWKGTTNKVNNNKKILDNRMNHSSSQLRLEKAQQQYRSSSTSFDYLSENLSISLKQIENEGILACCDVIFVFVSAYKTFTDEICPLLSEIFTAVDRLHDAAIRNESESHYKTIVLRETSTTSTKHRASSIMGISNRNTYLNSLSSIQYGRGSRQSGIDTRSRRQKPPNEQIYSSVYDQGKSGTDQYLQNRSSSLSEINCEKSKNSPDNHNRRSHSQANLNYEKNELLNSIDNNNNNINKSSSIKIVNDSQSHSPEYIINQSQNLVNGVCNQPNSITAYNSTEDLPINEKDEMTTSFINIRSTNKQLLSTSNEPNLNDYSSSNENVNDYNNKQFNNCDSNTDSENTNTCTSELVKQEEDSEDNEQQIWFHAVAPSPIREEAEEEEEVI